MAQFSYGLFIQNDAGTVVYTDNLPEIAATNSLDAINELGALEWRHHTTFPVPGNASLLSHIMEKITV